MADKQTLTYGNRAKYSMSQATRVIYQADHTTVHTPSPTSFQIAFPPLPPPFPPNLKPPTHKTPRSTTNSPTVFAGHDASRALGLTSTKAEDVSPDWSTLDDKEKGVLEDWLTFFSKRYNVVGVVEGATNQ